MKNLFDVTNNVVNTPKYIPPSVYTPADGPKSYAAPVVVPTSLAPKNPNEYVDPSGIKLMHDPIFPNQFEGEHAAIRLIKNSLLAGARMMLYEFYRGMEIALSRYLWPPTMENIESCV